ncbi:MAG: DUF4169 family protein [Gammaproteobacteria bacterium]|nr:DUF4169 family protein [Gammaproteobacteria bacterium]
MAKIINLNRARKARARAEDERRAAENRIRFGRSKAQKQLDAARLAAERAKIDSLHRQPPPGDEQAPPTDGAS